MRCRGGGEPPPSSRDDLRHSVLASDHRLRDDLRHDAFAYSPFAARVETVTWQGQPLRMYTQEAPGFELDDDFAGKIVAHYADGTPAALLVRHGKGQVALSGPHPEATADWLAADNLPPEPLPGPDLAADFLRLAISRR